MNPTQTASNGALLRFMPYPQTGELVNVGVLMNCLQPRFLHFLAEERMPYRVKAFFPTGRGCVSGSLGSGETGCEANPCEDSRSENLPDCLQRAGAAPGEQLPLWRSEDNSHRRSTAL